MNLNLANCPRCGRVFAKGIKDVCPVCIQEIEKEYQKCAEYLREHRGTTIYELSEQTGVSIRQITRFIREGRISLVDAPNLGYPCETCGELIREGSLCAACRKRLTRDIQFFQDQEERARELQKQMQESVYQIRKNEEI
jgi:flagellar operon protein (TIGR03826 family)